MSLTEELVLKRSKASSLDAVRNLNCWGCGLHEVSVLARIPNLEVLNISCNNLTSLKDLRTCHKLRELYIRRNQVSDFSELDHLAKLPNLTIVWLNGNPLSTEPSYRGRVVRRLQQIKKLDNVAVTSDEQSPEEEVKGDIAQSSRPVLDAVLLLLSELKVEELNKVKGQVEHLLSKQ